MNKPIRPVHPSTNKKRKSLVYKVFLSLSLEPPTIIRLVIIIRLIIVVIVHRIVPVIIV